MNEFSILFTDIVKKIPADILASMMAEKLSCNGIAANIQDLRSSAERLLAGDRIVNIDCDSDVSINITSDDFDVFVSRVDVAMKGIGGFAAKFSDVAAKNLFKRCCQVQLEREVDGSVEEFLVVLSTQWGGAIRTLKIMLGISREIGQIILSDPSLSSHSRPKIVLMLRLHVRACQVADEIILLLQNGFADGAMARWRTMHEICVIISLINKGSDELVFRFVDHEAVATKQGASAYIETATAMGLDPISAFDVDVIEANYSIVRGKYGKEFCDQYGWANILFDGRRATFSDLEKKANFDGLRSTYKLASSNVHAGSRFVFHSLCIDGSGLVSGRSNVGLHEPGRNTAHSFGIINSILLSSCANMDCIVATKALLRARRLAVALFDRGRKKAEKRA